MKLLRDTNVTLSQDQIQYLKNQIFSDNKPGALLKDFSTLLDFIGPSGISVSGKYHLMPIKLLPQLNQLMSQPVEVTLKRPVQKSFPHINGLYLLLRASGLTQITVEKKDVKMMLDNKALADWTSLNPTERYFALFSAWWLRGSTDIIGESDSRSSLYDCLSFFIYALSNGLGLKEKRSNFEFLRYDPGFHNLALMELFGFIQIELDATVSKENWPIVNITSTTWGHILLNNFYEHSAVCFEHDTSDEELIALWRSDIKTYIPALERDLKAPEIEERQDSLYVFKVSLGSAYRKIAVPGTIGFEWLADYILSAFDFDNDHLYEFIYKNRYGVTERVVHPYMESDELCTTDCVIGELSLYVGMEIIFHFDFGDDWRFKLVVESIANNDAHSSAITVIERRGEPPEQYPDWDES